MVPVLQEAIYRGGVEPHEVNEVILGHCIQRTDEAMFVHLLY
jgi:acetyl-CoA C-acetyltransferase